jgi:hypothetical protein
MLSHFVVPKNMKFTGLILICATSCLALILPAIGVVQFPKNPESTFGPSSLSPSQGFPVMAQTGLGTTPTNQPWTQELPFASQPNSPFPGSVLPPSSRLPTNPTTPPPFTSPTPKDAAGQMQGAQNTDVNTASNNKLGLGLWLLLAPVCLVGLAMWTFSPNPSGVKPRSRPPTF